MNIMFVIPGDTIAPQSPASSFPEPYTTALFPKPAMTKKRKKCTTDDDECCVICLESLNCESLRLVCGHHFHRHCILALLPCADVYGERSMLRCPVCRETIVLEDLPAILGVPGLLRCSSLVQIHRRVALMRSLFPSLPSWYVRNPATAPPPHRVVKALSSVSDVDGFVYNTALLCIERSLVHRFLFQRFIQFMINSGGGGHPRDTHDFVSTHLTGHVEFLIKTGFVPL